MLGVIAVFNPTANFNESCSSNSTFYKLDRSGSTYLSGRSVYSATSTCLCNKGFSSTLDGASIANRYSFHDSTADDSVGTLNGVLMHGAYIVGDQAVLLYYGSILTNKPSLHLEVRFHSAHPFHSNYGSRRVKTTAAKQNLSLIHI